MASTTGQRLAHWFQREREERMRRWRVLRPMLIAEAEQNAVAFTARVYAAAQRTGHHPSTIYRWLRAARREGTI